jgi:serine/threonine-protein kinase
VSELVFTDTTGAVRTTLSRSAVLPRVEVAGQEAKLVLDPRTRYEERRMLGAGGVGEVVEALDNDIGRTVALKRLLPEMRAPTTLLRFIDEIRTIGGLEHPNIVPIHDVGVDAAGQYYFVMKYVQGETLESIIDKLAAGNPEYHRKYTFERRVQLFMGILEAVHYAHAKGYIHRDIKPANVMVGPFGEVMVMDWGLAKKIRGPDGAPVPALIGLPATTGPEGAAGTLSQSSSFGTAVGSILGTPAYMSPEQAMGDAIPVDERSDVYSLSVLFYELLTLHHYLGAKQRTLEEMLGAVIHEKPVRAEFVKSPHQGPPPAELAWFLLGGMAKNPADRYQSVAEMIARLGERRDGNFPVQCPITFVKRLTHGWLRFVDKHPFLVMGCISAILLLFLGGIIYGSMTLIAN